jgi:hypothetical protein
MPASRHSALSCHPVLKYCLLGSIVMGSSGLVTQALAQDSAFLACARFEDRGQRIACLEDTLEAATAAQAEATPGAAAIIPAAPVAAPAPMAAETAVPATAGAPGNERSLLDRIRTFGQDQSAASLSTDGSGQDRLHDSITALEKRNNLWIVTLSTGQVWRQTYPRNLLLREGDEVVIDQKGIGSSYRLSTPRLSGSIRVERAR